MHAPMFRVLLLATALLAANGLAQPTLESAAESQRRIVDRIEQIQSKDGPSSAQLIAPLTELALFYEDNGDEELAIALTERVIAVVRTNYGLNSLDQVPMILRLIDAAEARGDFATVWDLEQRLLVLAARNPNDLRSVPIWSYIGDLRIDMLERYINGELPERMKFGCYHEKPAVAMTGCVAGSRNFAARSMLIEAHDYYASAIDILLREDPESGAEVERLEMLVVASSYKYGRYFEGPEGCERWRDGLSRINENRIRTSAPLHDRVESLVLIADAELVCSHNALAANMYERAWELAASEGLDPEAMDRFFAPQTPILLPTFLQGPLVVAGPQDTDKSVEVAFELTRFGLSRDVKVVADKGNGIASDVRRLIRRRRFRPVVSAGEITNSSEFVLRYALAEPESNQ